MADRPVTGRAGSGLSRLPVGLVDFLDLFRPETYCSSRWCQAKERLRPYDWRRASAALEVLGTGRARYLQDGYA